MCSSVIWPLVLLCFPITGCVSAEEHYRKCLLIVTNELQNLKHLMPYIVQIMWNIWDILNCFLADLIGTQKSCLVRRVWELCVRLVGGKRLMVETVIGFPFSGILRSSEGQLCVMFFFCSVTSKICQVPFLMFCKALSCWSYFLSWRTTLSWMIILEFS